MAAQVHCASGRRGVMAAGGARAATRDSRHWIPQQYICSSPGNLAFQKGLSRAGYAAGQNVIIEIREAEGRYDQLPALAAYFVRRKANVIVAAGGLVSARAAIAATTTIPILFIAGFDPMKTRSLQPSELVSSRWRHGIDCPQPTLGSNTSKPAA
jgi:hypothetical protein